MLLVALGFGAFSLLLSAGIELISRDPAAERVVAGNALFLLAAGGAFIVLLDLLLYYRTYAPRLEQADYVLVLGVYFVQVAVHFGGFAEGRNTLLTGELVEILVWTPVIFAITFLLYDNRRALRRSGAVFGGVIVISGVNIYRDGLDGVLLIPMQAVADILLANAVMIALLYVFTLVRDELLELRVETELQTRLANTDALTGLANRRRFDEIFVEEQRRARRYAHPLALAMRDLDRFKEVNNRLSHAVGDETLREVARLLRENVREVDVVARFGGEEFVMLFPETTLERAEAACEKVREAVAGYPWERIHPELRITVSIGVVDMTRFDTLEAGLAAADTRLYRAKDAGRNRVCA